MRRKLIRQGNNALTVTLPAKWLQENNLNAGDEIDIDYEGKVLSLSQSNKGKHEKTVSITVDTNDFELYRSLIGSYYRAGYDVINVHYSNVGTLLLLQKIVDVLYGFEILDSSETGCVIKNMYSFETTDVQTYFTKMIHIITTMQSLIHNHVTSKKKCSDEELSQFKFNAAKMRDIIARIIVHEKSLDQNVFPYYLLSFNLWNITRNYYKIFKTLKYNAKLSPSSLSFFNETNSFFSDFFGRLQKHSHSEIDKRYRTLVSNGELLQSDKNNQHLLLGYCINILMLLQSSNSTVLHLSLIHSSS